ncbi:hypothetical protein [Alkalicoccus urumqiensis]|uniref:Uncharacterized protein n=1 Tax=Alkalicoccus urumqiensis TaxID=1548213 RepID=A0A2P6MKD4_ALKUR|nr:hypothetical protein [Alkalicoccus urumqiensis]PRO66705.1 hypothetical protein C6I21_01895 [Alkalicoccus urumqiensis]
MDWSDLTEGAKAVLEQTRNIKNDRIQIVEFEVGFTQSEEEADGGEPVSIQEEDYQSLKRYTQENEYGEKYHMARNKGTVKIILLEDGKIPDNLSDFPIHREYKTQVQTEEEAVEEAENEE